MTPRGRTLPMSRWTLLVTGALAMATWATPAAADWLVMNDGTSVETQGTWTEQGKLAVFTDTNGNLVSLRLSEVDLAASRQATADAVAMANRPVPEPEPRPESVFKITDADVGHVDPEDEDEAEEGEAEGEDSDAEAAPGAVSVIGWDSDEASDDGVTIRATLGNQGEDVAVAISVAVTIYDVDGTALSTVSAQLESTGLVPGQTTNIVAVFPGFFEFVAVDFDVQHRSLATRAADEVPSAEGSPEIEG